MPQVSNQSEAPQKTSIDDDTDLMSRKVDWMYFLFFATLKCPCLS